MESNKKKQILMLFVAVAYIILTIWFAENRSERIFHQYYPDCMTTMEQLQTYREDITDPDRACRAKAYEEARTARIVVMGASLLLVTPLLSWAYARKFDKREDLA